MRDASSSNIRAHVRPPPRRPRPRPLLPKAATQIAPPHGHDHISFPAHRQSFCNIIFILCRERVLVIRHTRIKTSPAKISHDATTCCYQSLVHDRYSHRRKKTLAVCSSTKACSITHELWSILPPVRHHCQRRRSKRRRRTTTTKTSFNKIPHLDNQRLSLVGSYNSSTWLATKKTTKKIHSAS